MESATYHLRIAAAGAHSAAGYGRHGRARPQLQSDLLVWRGLWPGCRKNMLKNPHSPTPRVRVAVVASSLRLAGAEKQTIYIARALFEAGIDVRFFHLGPNGYYEAVLRHKGIPMRQIYTAKRPLSMLARLTGALCRLRPDIVLVSQFGDVVYGVPAGRCCGALTLGGIRSDGLQELNARGRLSPWIFRVTHGFIVNSYRGRTNLLSRKITADKL